MLASKRTDNTKCLINIPNISMTKIIGLSTIASGSGNSIDGTCPIQKPTGPILAMPAPITQTNTIIANAPVVASAPVGEPSQGTNPSKLRC